MIDEQLLELDGYRLTLSHEIISTQKVMEKVHPLYIHPALTLERAEEARLLMLEASELMHELNSVTSTLEPLHNEYDHGS